MATGKVEKIKLSDLKDAESSLSRVMNMDLPVKPSYWLGRNLDRITRELKLLENTRTKMIEKYKLTDVGQEPTKAQKTSLNKMSEEWLEHLDTEIEVEFFPVKVSDFATANGKDKENSGLLKTFKPIDFHHLRHILVMDL